VATQPGRYDVVVTLNLYGDIISDVTAELSGSVGMAGSANVGDHIAMFEAIHGSAPDIAGLDVANPSGLLNAACMLLVHAGKGAQAERVQNAWLATLEDGVHTADIFREGLSTQRVGTAAFADAVIERLGRMPKSLVAAKASGDPMPRYRYERAATRRELCGVDVFVCDDKSTPDELAAKLRAAAGDLLQLKLITNRGVKVWPEGFAETFCTDHWRCRFVGPSVKIHEAKATYEVISADRVIGLLSALHAHGVEAVKTENLYLFDGVRGFSLGQGE
jgi:isocitrate dehydrogenase